MRLPDYNVLVPAAFRYTGRFHQWLRTVHCYLALPISLLCYYRSGTTSLNPQLPSSPTRVEYNVCRAIFGEDTNHIDVLAPSEVKLVTVMPTPGSSMPIAAITSRGIVAAHCGLLAARNEGYGVVLTTMVVAEKQRVELLAVPDDYAIAAILPIGQSGEHVSKLTHKTGHRTRERFDGESFGT